MEWNYKKILEKLWIMLKDIKFIYEGCTVSKTFKYSWIQWIHSLSLGWRTAWKTRQTYMHLLEIYSRKWNKTLFRAGKLNETVLKYHLVLYEISNKCRRKNMKIKTIHEPWVSTGIFPFILFSFSSYPHDV